MIDARALLLAMRDALRDDPELAAQLRELLGGTPASEWLDATTIPVPRKSILIACRSGALRATKRGRRWLVRREDADAFLRAEGPAPKMTVDDDVRRRLGVVRCA